MQQLHFENLDLQFSMNKLISIYFIFIFVFQVLPTDASLFPLTRAGQMEEFFPEIKGNLTSVTWDHAVNSLELLNESLNSDVMMIEADIVMGTLYDKSETIPIMAHPPNNTSNLSLELFLQNVTKYNRESKGTKKGVKLDFKTTSAFNNSVEIIEKLYKEINYPVWLNADILPGPVNANNSPVDPDIFISQTKSFKNAILSLGWQTNYGNGINNASYSKDNIEAMITTIKRNIKDEEIPPITFPVRAGIAAQSIDELLPILKEVKNSTLTIWGSEDDDVNVEALRNLIRRAKLHRVYVDVPKSLLDNLRLDQINAGMSVSSFALLTVITAVAVLVKLF